MLPNFDRAYLKGIISKIMKIYGPQGYEQRNEVHDIIKKLHLMPLQSLKKRKNDGKDICSMQGENKCMQNSG